MEISFLSKKNTITREHLARAIKKETGLPINKSSDLVDKFFDKIILNLKDRSKIKLRLFGVFSIKHKKQRIGRNPKNLEAAIIPERDVVKFKVAPTLKKKINDNIHQYNT